MALCPFCHDDKFFFAPKCTNCNEPTPLLLQCYASLLATILPLAMFVGFFWGIGELLGY